MRLYFASRQNAMSFCARHPNHYPESIEPNKAGHTWSVTKNEPPKVELERVPMVSLGHIRSGLRFRTRKEARAFCKENPSYTPEKLDTDVDGLSWGVREKSV